MEAFAREEPEMDESFARIRAVLRIGALGLMAAMGGAMADAAELRVLTTGAYKPVAQDIVAAFEASGGHKVRLDNDTAGALAKRIEAGEEFDLVILTPGALTDLAKKGKVAGDAQELARVGIGVAVKESDPRPDVSTVAAFRAALAAARKVAMIDPAAGGSSGIYLSRLFEQWGIAPEIRAKSVLVPGGLVAQRLVTGEADLAIHQISEILAVKGAVLVAPLPDEIQNWTIYAGALSAQPREPDAARALLAALRGPDARRIIEMKGMRAP